MRISTAGLTRCVTVAGFLLAALACGGDASDGEFVPLAELQAGYDEEEPMDVDDAGYRVEVNVFDPDTEEPAVRMADVELAGDQITAMYFLDGEELDVSGRLMARLGPSGCATFAADDGRVFDFCLR